MTFRLVIVVSHPIQHFVPFYRALAAHSRINLTVVYCSKIGVDPYFDKAMNTTIAWKMDLLGGYDHIFLPEADSIKSTGPRTVNNPSVTKELNRLTPDAVLIYGYNFVSSLRALWWCRRSKVPVMMISDSELKTVRSRWVKMFKRLILPALLRQFQAFITVGDCNEDYYTHYGIPRDRFFRSPFTIDEHSYREARANRSALRTRLRRDLGISDSDIVCLTVGKFSRRKRPHDVVAAARELAGKGHQIRFVLAGNGEMLDELNTVVEKEGLPVHLVGFVNVDALPAYYAAADLILHPSSRDPHPLVMSEAACIGLPLIISDRVGAAGPRDVARPGENAVVFPVGDSLAIADTVLKLCRAPEQLVGMGSRSIEIFDELDINKSVKGVVDALEYCVID